MAVNVCKIECIKCHEVGRPQVCYIALTKSLTLSTA